MKYLVSILLLAFSCVALGAKESKFRKFTDTKGREMTAKLTQVSGDDVFIERKDGMTSKVNVSIFSREDQDFIRLWEKKSALLSGDVKIEFKTLVTERSKWNKDLDPAYQARESLDQKSWKEGYKIEIANESDFDMKDVRVEYQVFKFVDALAAEKRSDGQIENLRGTARIDLIERRGESLVETDQFLMRQTRMKPNWRWENGGKETSEDKMHGVWVRVYAGDLLVAEDAKPETIMRNYTW